MRSLSTRLVLAFALTSLVGIGLAALFVRQLVTNQFDAFMLQQRRSELVSRLASYYAVTGSWRGFRPAVLLMGPLDRHDGSSGRADESRWLALTLVDRNGSIVFSPNPRELGRPVTAAELASGATIELDGVVVGTVILPNLSSGRNPEQMRYLAGTDRALGAAGLVALAVALALGLLLARLITRPVRELTRATQALAAGELGAQVAVRSHDELGLLARQFNTMSRDLERATTLRRRMTADIAHDLRTPLTVIAGYLEALRDEVLRPTPTRFAMMYDETQVLLRLVEDLHTLSLADSGELILRREPLDTGRLLNRAVQTYRDAAAQVGVSLSAELSSPVATIFADPDQLVRVLGNLVTNALRHTPPGGTITLGAHDEAAAVTLTVADSGEGIAPEHLPNIFERFYRVDSSRHTASGGSGLGLAIVRSIVEAHGGRVAVTSRLGEGTTFQVTMPTAAAQL